MSGGYTYTLTTYATKYLAEAESLYGPRMTNYIYAGIELVAEGGPRTWYPQNKYVVIQLTHSTASNLRQGIFQLSHEVIHLLSPNGMSTTNNLEEGLATLFSKKVTDRDTGDEDYAEISIAPTKYYYPYTLVSQLLDINPDAVIELRKVQPMISSITKGDFLKANLEIPEELIEELVKPMEY
ncbi:hypothetical protein [Pontibacter ruber]|uniref:IrrE N-terminal-like domain-containing protein n=2 Tax=Pontibacter ruber TaxID=1343895 RepID=A0ABW5CZV7_9BACT